MKDDHFKGNIVEISIELLGTCEHMPFHGMDEEYGIDINNKGCHVKSRSTWGLLRGLESLTHLVYYDGYLKVNKTIVQDKPKFTHRGILLDTARHYLPKSIILQQLDLMEMNKFNVLDWHMTDDD